LKALGLGIKNETPDQSIKPLMPKVKNDLNFQLNSLKNLKSFKDSIKGIYDKKADNVKKAALMDIFLAINDQHDGMLRKHQIKRHLLEKKWFKKKYYKEENRVL
jgi:hypothetical protein